MPPHAERLDSWKAIAEYLHRDQRTVRRWEKTMGLPVRRVPGVRGSSVFAYVEEIETWLQRAGPEAESIADAPRQPALVTVARLRPRGRWMMAAAAAVVMAIGFMMWWRLPSHASATPLRFQVTPTGVVATDSYNRERWRYTFPVDEQAYLPEGLPWAAPRDGAGVFVLVSNRQRRINRSSLGGVLLSLGADGRLRRQIVLDDRIGFGEHGEARYGPPWNCLNFRMDDRAGAPRLAVAAHHEVWWPGLAVSDLHGPTK